MLLFRWHFPFFLFVCYWGMTSYWFQRTVLTPSWSIVEGNSSIFQRERKCHSFMLGVNLLPLKTNFSTHSCLWCTSCIKGDINGRKWIAGDKWYVGKVSGNETVAGNITKMCEDTVEKIGGRESWEFSFKQLNGCPILYLNTPLGGCFYPKCFTSSMSA